MVEEFFLELLLQLLLLSITDVLLMRDESMVDCWRLVIGCCVLCLIDVL